MLSFLHDVEFVFIKSQGVLCGEIGQLQFIQGKYPADFQVKSRTRAQGSIDLGLSVLVCWPEAPINLISVRIVQQMCVKKLEIYLEEAERCQKSGLVSNNIADRQNNDHYNGSEVFFLCSVDRASRYNLCK